MPISDQGDSHDLVRRAKTIRGKIRYRMVCEPRFDYGQATHKVQIKKHEVLFISCGADKTALRLRSEVPLKVVNGAAVAEFTLHTGESAAFILEQARPKQSSPSASPDYVSESFKRTMNFWQQWIKKSQYQGRWREMVN